MNRRPLGLAVAAGVMYLLLAAVSFTFGALPTVPLYDGVTIDPYRFVKPPEALAEFNRKPYSYRGRVPTGPDGFQAVTAGTIDNHALVNLPDGSVASAPHETEIELTIEPLDPATLGAPPKKAGYDGNAYRFSARYAGSGKPVVVPPGCPAEAAPGGSPRCITVIIHYAFGPVLGRGDTRLYRRSDDGWTALPSKNVAPLQQVYGSSDSLGIFVSAGPNRPKDTNPKPFPTELAIALAISGLALGTVLLRLTRPWRPRRPPPPDEHHRRPFEHRRST